MKKKILLVSWFNGLGGASLAVGRLNGVEVVETYVSEVDDYANKVYFSNFDAVQFGDCRSVSKSQQFKMLGNGFEVNTVTTICNEILK